MKVYGLTGGIATGKSVVAAMFEKLGAGIIDADRIARSLTDPGGRAFDPIVEAFGEEILAEDGAIDRKKLRAKVFDDPEKRGILNRIVHPLIMEAAAGLIEEEEAKGRELALFEAALLVETGLTGMFYGIIVVDCDPEIQKQRLMERDGVSYEEAVKSLASQAPAGIKLKAADFVITNDRSFEDTRRQVNEIWDRIARKS